MIFSQCNNSGLEAELDPNTFADIAEDYGIFVKYDYSESFFPHNWLEPPISAHGLQIAHAEAARMEPIINDFLSQFSYAFLQMNLHKIYLLKRLYLYDRENHSGTTSKTDIYIINRTYPSDDLLGRLHFMFSYMLFRNHGDNFFPSEEWNAINDSEFTYGRFTIDGTEVRFLSTEEVQTLGLLEKQSLNSMQADFSMFAYWIFSKPEELQELCEKHEKIKEKYNLVKQFYDNMNSGVEF